MIRWISIEEKGLPAFVIVGEKCLCRMYDGDILLAYYAKGFFYSCYTTCEIDHVTHVSELNQPDDE